jgi:hypothetical protein
MIKNYRKTRQGSALIVTLMLMAILLVLTLGLSMLTISQIRQTGDVIGAGKAYYAAEAGIEIALLGLKEHLPGFQTQGLEGADADGWVEVKADDSASMSGDNLSFRYRIRNQGDAYPYFDADTPIFLSPDVGIPKQVLYTQHPDKTYNVLALNQTVTIPLFIDCGDGVHYKDVKNWLLQYYVDFDTDPNNKLQLGTKIDDFDILRWKLFGEPINPDLLAPARTHAISDFYPASENDSPTKPVCIGSDLSLAQDCIIPLASYVSITNEEIANWNNFKVTPEVFNNAWSSARECYTRDAGSLVAPSLTGVQKGCNIKTFIDTHRKNYLTITNVVNPDIIGITDPVLRAAKANIYYRIIAKPDPTQTCPNETSVENKNNIMAREYAQISADGYAGNGKYKQSIDAKLKQNSFLPVFNFTLFRTDPDKVNPEDVVVAPLPLINIQVPFTTRSL